MRIPARNGVMAARPLASAVLAVSLAVSLLVLAGPAEAGTWRIGRNQSDCPGGCHWYDGNCQHPGEELPTAMGSPSVVAGDTVKVWPGTYSYLFDMKSNVTLVSAEGPSGTFLSGASGTYPMIVWAATGLSTVIDGFTMQWSSGPSGTGGALAFYVASGVVRNCIIRNCSAGLGAGAYIQFSDVVLENNVFVDNYSTAGGGTLAVTGGAPTVRGNTFIGNSAPAGYQGAALYASGYPELLFERNIVTGTLGGSAIYCAGLNTSTMECNLVWDNEAGSFGGTCVDSSGASGNITADPYLCNPGAGDYAVCSDSPAATAACGPIGYQAPLGNCGPCGPVPVAELETRTWGQVKVLYR